MSPSSWSDQSSKKMAGIFKLTEGRVRLDVKKIFFAGREVRHWNKFHGVVVDVPTLEMFNAKLDGSLSNLIWWKLSLPMAGMLELGGL